MEEGTESTPGATNLLPHQASRTVFILGKIGVGKSTIANQIFGRAVFPVRPSMEAMTRTSKELLCQNCIVPLSDTEMNVTIKIVDTTGQFATTQYAARDLISACDGQVHLILLCYSKWSNYNRCREKSNERHHTHFESSR